MNVQPLNPKLQQRADAIARALSKGPAPEKIEKLCNWLADGETVGDEYVAVALLKFHRAHDSFHAFDVDGFSEGFNGVIDFMAMMLEYQRTAKRLLDFKAAGRLRKVSP